jgi:hypothetical protein
MAPWVEIHWPVPKLMWYRSGYTRLWCDNQAGEYHLMGGNGLLPRVPQTITSTLHLEPVQASRMSTRDCLARIPRGDVASVGNLAFRCQLNKLVLTLELAKVLQLQSILPVSRQAEVGPQLLELPKTYAGYITHSSGLERPQDQARRASV